jgi:hypothetical protein|tara:strand:- start:7384 stop:7599 length:216 start_codon:yes stop_codon:yes gene_type:complete
MANHYKNDPHAEMHGKGKVGIVGESYIWDGPLDQQGRLHAPGWSAGITGMQISKYPSKYIAGPITTIAKMG